LAETATILNKKEFADKALEFIKSVEDLSISAKNSLVPKLAKFILDANRR